MEGSSKAGEPVSSKVAPMPLVGGGIEEEELRMLDGEIEKLRSEKFRACIQDVFSS